MLKEQLEAIVPSPLREMLRCIDANKLDGIQELRMRIGQPFLCRMAEGEYGIGEQGITSVNKAYVIQEKDLNGMMRFITNFSLYALEDELKQGYITIEGGHRVGVVGQIVVENGVVKTMKYVSAMNIRIARQVIGCSNKVLPYLVTRDRIFHTLIVSPPKCGKTTLLRDMIRQLSNGYSGYGPFTVGVVDERSEIAGCYRGVPQNDVGIRTDVLDGCPKVEGMHMLLRSMAPQVIAVDEIGSTADIEAIEEVLGAGVTIISTVHGRDLQDCMKRPALKKLLENGLFEKVIILSNRQGPCTVESIEDLRATPYRLERAR